jgi:hypothetical protein
MRGWGVLGGLVFVGCGGEAAPPPVEPSLEEVEALLAAPSSSVHVPFEVEATGAMEAELTGDLFLGPEGAARLEARGSFAGREVDVRAVSDGERLIWSGAPGPVPTPEGLRDALVVGLTRMGILHNVARLTAGAPPDHMEGGVREWVVVSPDTAGAAPAPGLMGEGLARAIIVDGVPSGAFRLSFDETGRLPRIRRQGVDFPEGRMEVTERYPTVALQARFPEDHFVLPAAAAGAAGPGGGGR